MPEGTTPKHARAVDDKRRVTLPDDFETGGTVVLQPVEKGVWLIYALTEPVRHFVEADTVCPAI